MTEKKDWRIGVSVKPKFRGHELHYERGKVLDVGPSGTGGLIDRTGILKIEMESGFTFWARADEWITA